MQRRPSTVSSAAAPAPGSIVPRLYPGKLVVPQLPGDLLPRSALVRAWLDSGVPVITLEAPAGYGKTTLMGQIATAAHGAGITVAWLALDERDNDFSRCFVYLRAALQRAGLIPGDAAAALDPETAFSRLRAEAVDLVETVGASERAFLLCVDGFEHVRAADVAWLFTELGQNLLPGQRLALSGRSLRALPMASWEVQGRVMRLGTEQLTFDEADSRRFLFAREGLDQLPATAQEQLLNKARGWPAALRLLTLALPDGGPSLDWMRHLAGRWDAVSAYLAENVLTRLPAALRTFLLETSVLDTLYGAVCDAVTEREGSDALLAELHRQSVFITRLDTQPPCYQLHSLFRGLLDSELRRIDAGRPAVLHRRAAVFFSSSARYADAVEHARRSGDEDLLVELIELAALRHVELGQLDTVAAWLDLLPRQVVCRRAGLQRARAYAMTALHRYDEALDAMNRLRDAVQAGGRVLDAETQVQRLLMYEWMDRPDLSETEAAAACAEVGPDNPLAFAVAHNIMAYLSLRLADQAAAERHLATARTVYGATGLDSWPGAYSQCFEGTLAAVRGDLRHGMLRFQGGLASASLPNQAVPAAFLADALYQRGEIAHAGALAEEHLQLNRLVGPPPFVILCYRTAARVNALHGDVDRADALLTELGDIGDLRGLPRLKASAWLEKSRLAFWRGDHAAASRYLALGTAGRLWQSQAGGRCYAQELDDPAIAQARAALVSGDFEAAARRLEGLLATADAEGRRLRATRLRCLLAQAWEGQRRHGAAVTLLREALQVAVEQSLVRLVADEPWGLRSLLTEAVERMPPDPGGVLERLKAAVAQDAAGLGQRATPPSGPDLLTPKERAIVRLLADGRSNKEVARLLSITDNTVETHLRRIFRKLEVRNRTQAVTRAGELGQLP